MKVQKLSLKSYLFYHLDWKNFVVLCTALLWHSFSEYILTRCKLFLRATVRLAVIFIEIIKFQSKNIYKANQ